MMWAILPYTMVQREALAHGEFPLWNRYNTIGEPLWGQAQTFFLDPFHLASLAIPDPSVAMDLRFIVGRVVFAIGSGLAVAVVTGNGLAAVLVALLAPFVGHFTARFNHPGVLLHHLRAVDSVRPMRALRASPPSAIERGLAPCSHWRPGCNWWAARRRKD